MTKIAPLAYVICEAWKINVFLLYDIDRTAALAIAYGASVQRYVDEEGCGAVFAAIRFGGEAHANLSRQ
jgi:hypothetical protein